MTDSFRRETQCQKDEYRWRAIRDRAGIADCHIAKLGGDTDRNKHGFNHKLANKNQRYACSDANINSLACVTTYSSVIARPMEARGDR